MNEIVSLFFVAIPVRNISSTSSRYDREKTIELHLPFINFRAANVNFLFPGEMQNFVGEKKYT